MSFSLKVTYYDTATSTHVTRTVRYSYDYNGNITHVRLGLYIQADPIGGIRDYSKPQFQIAIDIGVLEESSAAGEGLNHLYGYVGQNPIYWIDPYGLAKGGNQNQGSSEFNGMSDADVSARERDSSISKNERRKAQKEEKARGARNKNKRKNNKGKGKLKSSTGRALFPIYNACLLGGAPCSLCSAFGFPSSNCDNQCLTI